ncbi:DUF2975 domain-containing protein [Tessaracoccus oleiagri]|uniref:DUF2975 domain-containing protein n=1 Tax=Tessaracoccus oleiagri TaxID=686624 RepID=A0A1G9H497_9ACTN|nr:DUF2975 domain-containing protein [Tessaracoccus oleiagri]SDL07777.1 Protein of unknown function [Tessaracoccus oleiagri]
MKSYFAVTILRGGLLAAVAIIVVAQVLYLPWYSGMIARELPAEAYMRWPILTLAILGLLCVQVVLVCTQQLLSFVPLNEVFQPGALGWVDGIIAAFLAGSFVCLATLVYQAFTVSGPPLWSLALLAGVMCGVGLALLVWVMRTFLVQAIEMRAESDVVT